MRYLYLNADKIVYRCIFVVLLIATLVITGFSVYVWIDLYNNVQIVDYSTTNTYIQTSNNKQLTILDKTYNLENDINNVKVDETIFGLTLNNRWYMKADYNQKIEYKSRISYSVDNKTYESNHIIADIENARDKLAEERSNLYFKMIPVPMIALFAIITIFFGFLYFHSARNLKIYFRALYDD